MKNSFKFDKQRTKSSEMLSTASDVWVYLTQNGGLSLGSYDKELPHELFKSLQQTSPSTSANDLETLLKDSAVSVEDFLVAFFKVIQPYADMMVDLMCLFEQANANQGKQNLSVRFNFDKDLPPLDFNLEHFRRWQEIWQNVAGIFLAKLWESDSLWELNRLLRSSNDNIQNTQMQQWLQEYSGGANRRGRWPLSEPPSPQCGVRELDLTLTRVWSVWLTVVRQSKIYGPDRETLRHLCFGVNRTDRSDYSPQQRQEPWTIELLGGLDSDHWAALLAQGAFSKAEFIAELPEPERSRQAAELNQALSELFESLLLIEIEGEVLQSTLQDFLSLPIWQRRHELYSAWISTQIINALHDNAVDIHSSGGQLLFEFKGTHLATFGTLHPNLHLMAELRSPLNAPRGEGRKRAIQPDYSLITSPITSPECSVLEVECKQYQIPSKRKFADALTDYANGRPNAEIILVNYGPAESDILDKVDAGVSARTHVIGLMRPRSEPSQTYFAELVKDSVLKRCPMPISPMSLSTHKETGQLAGQIVLNWESMPKDLDLYLKVLSKDQEFEVSYSSMGNISTDPWALLNQDSRAGYGPEVIQIARWLDGTYRCAVHNYSGDKLLAGCGAKMTITLGKQELDIECPTSGTGDWWDVFWYSPIINKLEIYNRIATSFV